jgi:hypothetical protein
VTLDTSKEDLGKFIIVVAVEVVAMATVDAKARTATTA